jgi:site-specific recombinase XerC
MFPEIERFNKWLRCQSPHTATHIHYTSDVNLFFAWATKPPDAVTLHDVDAYVAHCRGLGHAVATVNRRLAALRAFYRFLAVESDDVPPNPVLPRRHAIRQGQRLPRDAPDTEVQKLFAAITSPRDRAMFLIMLKCGLRVCEVHRLSVDDLCLQPPPGRPPHALIHGKNDAWRTVYLSPQVVTALQEWLAVRPAVKGSALFLSRYGRRLSIAGIQARLAHYCHRAGVWITCHQLRHVFGRHMVEAGMPVTSIQRLLGHQRLRTTQTYLYLSDRQIRTEYEAAMACVSKWLSPEARVQ